MINHRTTKQLSNRAGGWRFMIMEVDKSDHSEVLNSQFKFYKGGKKRVT